ELRSAALHGLAISLITALSVYGGGLAWSTLFRDASGPLGWPEWVGSALSGAVLLWLVAVLLRAHGVRLGSLQARAALAVAAVLALATLKAPGLAPAIVILLTGFANGNRLLVGAGIVALVLYLSSYYYLLEVTLLTKSVVLFFTGIALLGARMLLNRAWPDREVQRAYDRRSARRHRASRDRELDDLRAGDAPRGRPARAARAGPRGSALADAGRLHGASLPRGERGLWPEVAPRWRRRPDHRAARRARGRPLRTPRRRHAPPA